MSDIYDELGGRVTYSLEAEDILIKRMIDVFRLRPDGTPGRYIDLGAFHPTRDSNTYRFYRQGWRGILVEPNPDPLEDFKRLRPEDELWNIAVAPAGGALLYHRFDQPGLNGFLSPDMLQHHLREGYQHLGSTTVDCVSVSDFIGRLAQKEIDFLDIDVETLDAPILEAWDWRRCRPKLICAEVHRFLLSHIEDADVTLILARAGYSAMCRGWQSVIYVANEYLSPDTAPPPIT